MRMMVLAGLLVFAPLGASAQTQQESRLLVETRQSAELGDPESQFRLGFIYERGIGVAPDFAEAMHWYLLAAEQGNLSALNTLGRRYRNGDGVVQDYAEAMRWYRAAASLGDPEAQTALAFMYSFGEGVPQSYVVSHMWHNLAAANGGLSSPYYRDTVAELMTPADISEAQRRARVCLESGYRDCD